MSWVFDGTNRVVFSGKDGLAQFAQLWTTAQKFGGVQLPSPPADNSQYFAYGGFIWIYRPML